MSERGSLQVGSQGDDEGSDAGDPFEAGAKLLALLSPATQQSLARLNAADTVIAPPDPAVVQSPFHGPQPQFKFWWRGRRCDFAGATMRYRLVQALWDSESGSPRPECDVNDVLNVVYGEDTAATWGSLKSREKRLKSLMNEVRVSFRQAGLALGLRRADDKVWLEELDDA